MKYTVILIAFMMLAPVAFVLADDEHDSDEIILQLAPGVSIDTINAHYNTTTDDVLISGSVYKVKVSDPSLLDSTVAEMQKDPDIALVEFNYFGDTPEGVRRTLAVVDANPTPSKYQDQTAYTRISAAEAHTISTGQNVVVAVIDTGVDYNHPDLANHIQRDNTNKVVGYDFVDNDDDPMDSTNGIDDDNDGQIDEGAGHGTHIAGIISLIAPDAKILPIRVLNSDGFNTVDAVAKGIDWAVEYAKENKLKMVINLSLGLPKNSFLLLDSIEEALHDGIPVIASAGNDNSSVPHFPAANDNTQGDVVGVAGTDQNDIKASFSNFGIGWIDISAPSVGIYSTFLNGQYAWWDGTSMSAPFISGETALVMSTLLAKGVEEPSLASILKPVENGVDYIYNINPAFKLSNQLGRGRVDLYSAVQIANGSDILSVKKATFTGDGKLVLEVKSSAGSKPVLKVEGVWKMRYSSKKNRYVLSKSMSVPPPFVTVTSSKGGTIQIYLQ